MNPRLRDSAAVVAAALAVVSGCDLGFGDDPYSNLANDPCMPGHERVSDSACILPYRAIVIDGKAIDWSGVESHPLSTECADCGKPLIESLQAALTFDEGGADTLMLRATLAGGAAFPAGDDQLRYVIELRALDEHPNDSIHALILSGKQAAYRVNDQYVDPVYGGGRAFTFAHTLDGFEVSIPVPLLPFASGAAITASVAQGSGEALTLRPAAPTVVRACWDTLDYEKDPCAPRRAR